MYRMKMYNEYDFNVKKTKGIYIWDDKGNKYMDTFSGIGVLALGHSNDEVLTAQKLQMTRFEHISNFFFQDKAESIAKILVENTGRTGQVFFTNSGTEAIEAALKAVKKKMAISDKKKIITFESAFHGRTLGSLSLNGFENSDNLLNHYWKISSGYPLMIERHLKPFFPKTKMILSQFFWNRFLAPVVLSPSVKHSPNRSTD